MITQHKNIDILISVIGNALVLDENTNIVANLHCLQWSSISLHGSTISRCIVGTFYLQQVCKSRMYTLTYPQFLAKNFG